MVICLLKCRFLSSTSDLLNQNKRRAEPKNLHFNSSWLVEILKFQIHCQDLGSWKVSITLGIWPPPSWRGLLPWQVLELSNAPTTNALRGPQVQSRKPDQRTLNMRPGNKGRKLVVRKRKSDKYISIYKITNKNLLLSTGISTQYSIVAYMGK